MDSTNPHYHPGADDIRLAIDSAVDDQRLRTEALKLAISAIRKMQYGMPGTKASLDLAEAFYGFLKGSKK